MLYTICHMLNAAKKIIFLGLIFLLPLIFDPNLQDFVLIKIIFLRLTTLFLIFLWLWEVFKNRAIVWKVTPINRWLFLLAIFSLAASFTSIHKLTSFFDSYIIHDGFFLHLNYLVLFFLTINFFKKEEIHLILWAIFLAGANVAQFGFLEFIKLAFFLFGLPSPWGIYSTVGFHNFSGAYLAMSLLAGLGLYFETSKKWLRYLIVTTLPLIFLGLMLTQSFSAGFGFGLGFLVLFGFAFVKKQIPLKKILAVVFLFFFLILLIFPLINLKMPLAKQIFRLKIDWALRVETWKATLKIIRDHQALGIGPDTFELIYPRYQTEKFALISGGRTITHLAHNEFLDVAVSRGLPALLIYLAIIFQVFRHGFGQNFSFKSAAVFGAIICYLGQNLFSFGEVSITSTFWVLVGLLWLEAPEIKINLSEFWRRKFIFVLILFLALAGWVVFYSARFYLADKNFVTAERAMNTNDFPGALVFYKKAVFFNPWRVEYQLHEAYAYLKLAEKTPAPKEIFLKEALEITNQAIKINPEQYAGYYLKGLIYQAFDDPELKNQAKNYFMQSLRLNPFRPEILEELSKATRL